MDWKTFYVSSILNKEREVYKDPRSPFNSAVKPYHELPKIKTQVLSVSINVQRQLKISGEN
jgi:hypothetical protein